jgi:hypothetical protein
MRDLFLVSLMMVGTPRAPALVLYMPLGSEAGRPELSSSDVRKDA